MVENWAGKRAHLESLVAQLGHVAVAYSGGVDSTLLLAVCMDVLGRDHVLALTVQSPMMAQAEIEHACNQAAALRARHLLVSIDLLANPDVAANPPDRCYHCKQAIIVALQEAAGLQGMEILVFGDNADDGKDYRPGSRAVAEMGVRVPLREAGLTKAEVRLFSRELGMATSDRPASPCLATRFPYGTPLTAVGLARVEAAEAALRATWGLVDLRVRDHFPVARLEVPQDMIARVAQADARAAAVQALGALGYRYVALDLTGYRLGSLNETL